MTFNADYSSTRTVEGALYGFNGEQFKDISITETKDSSWQTTALSGTAIKVDDNAAVVIGFDGVNSWGDPILTFAIGGAAAVSDTSEIANTNPIANDDAYTISENETLVLDVLTDDTDEDSDTLAIKSVGDATNGKVYLLDGSLVYSPDENFSGDDKFTYTVTDGKGGTDTATVNITINSVNEDAVANDDNFVVEQGSLATVLDLTANDTDGDGDVLSVTTVSATTNGGTVSLDLGVVSYKPAAAFNGTDSFTYTVSDGIGVTTTATATIIVEALNDAPTTTNDSVTLAEDNTVQIDVLANDTDDADTGNLRVASVGEASEGKVEIVMGYVFYTPNADYSGTDSFTYVAIDSEDATTIGTVNLTVNAQNDAPVTVNDVVTTEENTLALTIDVIGNDTDAESDTLTLLEVGSASYGVVAIVDGKVTYTPTADYSGADTFTYVVGDLATDGITVQSKTIGTVNITVSETNLDPITVDDLKTVSEDSSNNKVSVLVNDNDPNGNTLTLVDASQGAHGTTTTAGNDVMYTPDANYEGVDTFTYTVSDGKGGSKTGEVTVTVTGVNDAPTAVNDALGSVAVDQGIVKLDVLANDIDIDTGDSVTIKSVGTNGITNLGNQVSISQGKISYNANTVTNGTDSFDYIITDGDETATATATLTLSSNTNPDALNDQVTIVEDTATEIKVLSNDTDKDADRLSVLEINIEPENGSVSLTNGKVFYTPNANYVGTDSFTYIVKDGKGGRDEATVEINVTAVNDAPDTNVDQTSVVAGTTNNIIDVLSNDVDVDGDTITVTDIGTGATLKDGVVTLTNGVITYTPKDGFTGSDSFTYTVSDGTATATATANISVTAANTAPVAANNTVATVIVEDSRDNQIDLTASISDADDDTVSIVAVTQGEHGTVKLTAGKVFYTPDDDYHGSDSFTYTVNDESGGQDSGVHTLTISNVDDLAEAGNDDLGDIMIGSREVKLDLLSNDVDVDGDDIAITGVSDAKFGSVKFSDGSVYYTPGSNEGVDTFTYTITGGDTGTAKVNAVAPNNTPDGEVKITGSVQAGQTLTASNTLTDADTLGTISYQWHKDGVEMLGQTATTYQITLEDVGSNFTVKASYTDERGTLETVSSETTDVVTTIDAPFSFVSSTITGTDAANISALNGHTFDASDELIKLTLNLDLNAIYSRSDVESITAGDLDINIDWSKFEAISSVKTTKFVINKTDVDGKMLLLVNSDDTFDSFAVTSLRATDPLLTLVDDDSTNDQFTLITNNTNLLEVYLRPIDITDKLSIELSGTVSINQGTDTLIQYDSTMSNIGGITTNSTPDGSVTIVGTMAVDEILSASHTLTDEDGMSAVSYKWLRDDVEITDATSETYTLTTSDINKDISVEASYLDGGDTDESVSSVAQTLTQSTVGKPLMFTATLVTASEASIAAYGADYSAEPDETLVKLTLNADMARFADNSVNSIAGLELDFGLDWTQFETIKFAGDVEMLFTTVDNYTGKMFNGVVTDKDSGEITKIVLSSLNTSNQPLLTLVDNADTQLGESVINPSEDLITIYLNPKDTVKDFEVVYGGIISTEQGGDSFTQLSHSLEVKAKTYDAIVSTDSTEATNDTAATITKLTGDVTIDLWDSGATTAKLSIAVDAGEIVIDNTVTFDKVKLSDANAYDFDITINDALAVLRDIVDLESLTEGSNAFHAADINNDGNITINDALAVLRHIVDLEAIDTFDLIDSNGNRISELDATAAGEPPTWTLVANGDVNMSGGFDDVFVVTDMV
jgi:hypothetical protein